MTDQILIGQPKKGASTRNRRRLRRGQAEVDKPMPPYPSLNDRNRGETCRIVQLYSDGATRRRFLDMGFMPGAVVKVVRAAPLDDPIEILVADSYVTIRREEAAEIEVEDA